VLIAGFAGLCWLDWRASLPGIVLLPLAIVAALLAAGELLAMFRKKGHDPLAWVLYGGTLVTVIAAAIPGLGPMAAWSWATPIQGIGWLAIGLAVSVLVALVGELWRYDGSGRATLNLSLAVFAILYVGGFIGLLVQLRLLGGEDGRLGMFALLSLIAIVKMSDIGQYVAGRLFGRHKLAPAISPGKTWEGVSGGLVFAGLTAWLFIEPALNRNWLSVAGLLHSMFYAVAFAVAGLVGDLAESLLKRDAGVKDSSDWMPGFGGVLDLLDSLLGAAPVAYMFWALGLIGA
jgi:phosphatidate cytidylyltransferase